MEYPCGKISIYFGPMQQTKIQYISFKVTTFPIYLWVFSGMIVIQLFDHTASKKVISANSSSSQALWFGLMWYIEFSYFYY